MVGDVPDFIARMRRVLPAQWFPDNAPVLTALLTGAATAASWVFSQIQYLILQTRIATATGFWLDIISLDFFGTMYPRISGETDDTFRARLQSDFFPLLGTRQGLVIRLTGLLGTAPSIKYAWHPGDVGAWNYGSLGYGAGTGCYGSLKLNAQTFIYAPLPSGVTTASLYGSVANTIPCGTIGWVETSPNPTPPLEPDYPPGPTAPAYFELDESLLDGPDVLA